MTDVVGRIEFEPVRGVTKRKGYALDTVEVEAPPLAPIETITISTEGMAKFQHALDNPKPAGQALEDLMRREPPWELPRIAPTHWVQILHDKPSRRAFDLMNPDPACIDFDKMALTLSRLPRFGGQTKEGEAIYSVLQHEVEGCYAILRDTGNRKAAAAFLIHDHHEAIIGDQVTPVQRALQAHAVLVTGDLHAGEVVRDALASLRSTLDCAIYSAAGLEWPLDPETRRIVKEYDLRMCRTERDARMQPAPFSWHPSIEDAEPVVRCVLEAIDTKLYLEAFGTLCRKLLPAFGGAL